MFQKILLAVDLNDPDGAIRAAEYGSQLARIRDGELHVMNVVPDLGFNLVGSAFNPDHAKKMINDARAELSDWAAKALPEDVQGICHVAQGTIYDQIIRMADGLGADTIVVGAHRPELRDYLVGPNAARVVRHARQAVLVVR